MESVLGSVFIKITELLSGKLIETLLSKKGKKRKALLGLFSDINALEPLIEDLIRELLANGTEILRTSNKTEEALWKMQRILALMAKKLAALAPEFEIMAGDASSMLMHFARGDGAFVAALLSDKYGGIGSSPVPGGVGSPPQVAEQLAATLAEGRQARDALRAFIQQSYDWKALNE